MSDTLRFVTRLILQPKTIGAIAPSSRALATAMAAQIDPDEPGSILELGPGTGVATEALLARGIAPERITVVEYDRHFSQLIASRYSRINVINGDAFDLANLLGPGSRQHFSGAISGVPLLNHSVARRQVFLSGVLALLKPGTPYVQFSYGIRPPVAPTSGVSVSAADFVLFNLPPARVWVYRAARQTPSSMV